ncbi:MAG: hypothetical protein A3G24_20765 [Betaproteobacteria bacterium RIFCSPLOWO2_12_FULL_62_13]|nr:MAG: hypothetical protein A3G24_20765 [Betaproteobacteria bacterium RIFCSPLOWO2_12_FULL_62_13]
MLKSAGTIPVSCTTIDSSTASKDRSESDDPNAVAAASVLFLKLWGIIGGWLMARGADCAGETKNLNPPRIFCAPSLPLRVFCAEHVLPQALPLAREVTSGAESVLALDPARF